jgi:hypothetical protein
MTQLTQAQQRRRRQQRPPVLLVPLWLAQACLSWAGCCHRCPLQGRSFPVSSLLQAMHGPQPLGCSPHQEAWRAAAAAQKAAAQLRAPLLALGRTPVPSLAARLLGQQEVHATVHSITYEAPKSFNTLNDLARGLQGSSKPSILKLAQATATSRVFPPRPELPGLPGQFLGQCPGRAAGIAQPCPGIVAVIAGNARAARPLRLEKPSFSY